MWWEVYITCRLLCNFFVHNTLNTDLAVFRLSLYNQPTTNRWVSRLNIRCILKWKSRKIYNPKEEEKPKRGSHAVVPCSIQAEGGVLTNGNRTLSFSYWDGSSQTCQKELQANLLTNSNRSSYKKRKKKKLIWTFLLKKSFFIDGLNRILLIRKLSDIVTAIWHYQELRTAASSWLSCSRHLFKLSHRFSIFRN